MTITLAAVYAPIGLPGRADRLALPRVRLHPGRRGDHLRRRRADPFADDVGQAAQARRSRSAGWPAASTAASTGSETIYGRHARTSLWPGARRSTWSGSCSASLAVPMFMHVRQGAGADRGPGRHLRHRRHAGQRDARPDHASRRRASTRSFRTSRRPISPSRSPSRPAASGAWASSRGSERKRTIFQILPEVQQQAAAHSRHPDLRRSSAGAARRRRTSRSSSSSPRRPRPRKILDFAKQLQQKAAQSGMFAFPPLIDVKIDQPQSEIVIDRDKVAAAGPQPAAGRRRPRRGSGRQLRQPLQHRRPQLQGHPADPARRPPQPRAAQGHLRHRPGRQLIPLSTIATHRATPSSRARSTASSSSTRSRSAAWPSGRWTRRCASWKTRRPRSCPRATSSTTPASRASCARGQQVPAGLRPRRRPDLPGARGAVQQLPRPVRHPGRFGAAGHVRRAHLHLPQDARPGTSTSSPTAGRRRSTSTRRWGW